MGRQSSAMYGNIIAKTATTSATTSTSRKRRCLFLLTLSNLQMVITLFMWLNRALHAATNSLSANFRRRTHPINPPPAPITIKYGISQILNAVASLGEKLPKVIIPDPTRISMLEEFMHSWSHTRDIQQAEIHIGVDTSQPDLQPQLSTSRGQCDDTLIVVAETIAQKKLPHVILTFQKEQPDTRLDEHGSSDDSAPSSRANRTPPATRSCHLTAYISN